MFLCVNLSNLFIFQSLLLDSQVFLEILIGVNKKLVSIFYIFFLNVGKKDTVDYEKNHHNCEKQVWHYV